MFIVNQSSYDLCMRLRMTLLLIGGNSVQPTDQVINDQASAQSRNIVLTRTYSRLELTIVNEH